MIQHAHKDCKNKTNMLSIQRTFYLPNACPYWAIFLHNWMQGIDSFYFVFYYKGMLEKVLMQKTSNCQGFLCNWRNPVKCNACIVSQKLAIECRTDFSDIRLFLENHSLEFHEICHTLRNTKLEYWKKKWTLTEEILDIPVNFQQGIIKDLHVRLLLKIIVLTCEHHCMLVACKL